jgi:uncharacterized protein YbjT (DUF2867 family)
VIRPAVLFGLDDTFLNTLIKLLRRLPIYPMFGRGETRLQPTDVEDVAEAVARVMQRTETAGLTVDCGGPRVYSYEELLRTIVLLRHKVLVGRVRRAMGAAQHGHRGSVLTRAAIRRRRMVAIEFGTWRSGRSGGSSGSVTCG